MKLQATASHVEALPPNVWEAIKTAIITTGRQWGVNIAVDDDLTVVDAIARYWAAHRIQENARLASQTDDAG